MFGYILKRVLLIVPTALGVATLAFLLMHLVPGDPIEVLLGENAQAADRQALTEALGLHLPLVEQYKDFLWRLAHFDLGTSYYNGQTVTTLLAQRLPATIELAAGAILFALTMAFILGMWAAQHKGKWQDKTALTFSLVGFSMPSFWLGPLCMILFALQLGWLPVSGREGFLSLIMPSVTLGVAMAAMTARLLRASLLEVMESDYLRTAKAKGVPPKQLMRRHALRNALLPVVTVVFLQAGALLTGAILTEAVFSWPGVGSLIVESLSRRDYPVIQGCMLFIASVYMLMTLLSDLVYALFDPRIRYGGG